LSLDEQKRKDPASKKAWIVGPGAVVAAVIVVARHPAQGVGGLDQAVALVEAPEDC